MNRFVSKDKFIDFTGLTAIGIFCVCYVRFHVYFAELNIQLPFLDFPVFVGEILLFACLVLLLIRYSLNPQRLNTGHYLIMGYFIFVLTKALTGYLQWGPLALRHSALFYYPLFIMFGYAFFRREYFEWRICSLLTLIIALVIHDRNFHDFWTLSLLILGFVLIRSIEKKAIKALLFVTLLISVPYRTMFYTSRMMIVSNVVSIVFIVGMLPFVIRWPRWQKITLITILIGCTLFGLYKFSNKSAVKSIVNFQRMIRVLQIAEQEIELKKARYNPQSVQTVKLYNPTRFSEAEWKGKTFERVKDEVKTAFSESAEAGSSIKSIRGGVQKTEHIASISSYAGGIHNEEDEERELYNRIQRIFINTIKADMEELTNNQFDDMAQKRKPKAKIREQVINQVNLTIEYVADELINKQFPPSLVERVKNDIRSNFEITLSEGTPLYANKEFVKEQYYNDNASFRFLIWRDMIVEFWGRKPVFGFQWGKPLRSRSLEILTWGYSDWSRDGWIAAHNSYLNMIYRAGIVGAILIICYFTILFSMVKKFIQAKSLTGILLCAVIINWFVAANFLLIFELPYTAIPIWAIFGVTYAYARQLKNFDPRAGRTGISRES